MTISKFLYSLLVVGMMLMMFQPTVVADRSPFSRRSSSASTATSSTPTKTHWSVLPQVPISLEKEQQQPAAAATARQVNNVKRTSKAAFMPRGDGGYRLEASLMASASSSLQQSTPSSGRKKW